MVVQAYLAGESVEEIEDVIHWCARDADLLTKFSSIQASLELTHPKR